MTQTAREIADKLGVPDDPETLGIIIAYGNARIEDAAKVADASAVRWKPVFKGLGEIIEECASAIRSLATKEGEDA